MEMQPLTLVDDHTVYFKSFLQSLVDKFQPLQIFCFFKNAYLEETEGCFLEPEIKYQCDYCLLMITESPARIDHEAQDFSNAHYKQGIITLICHGKDAILEAVQANNRFFISVSNFGKLLYSHDGLFTADSATNFDPGQAGIKAFRHYHHRTPLADGFLLGASECLDKQQYNICTFMLHQAVEQTCIALIRVFVAYRSEVHNLRRLVNLCSCFSDQPYKMFLSTKEDERLFEVLAKSYSGARYKDNFAVSREDAHSLYERVVAFVALAKDMCLKKIVKLEHGVLSQGESTAERDESDE